MPSPPPKLTRLQQNELLRQLRYADGQHTLICNALGVSPDANSEGETASEAVNRVLLLLRPKTPVPVPYDGLSIRAGRFLEWRLKLKSKEQVIAALSDGDFAWDGKRPVFRGQPVSTCSPRLFKEICAWAGVDANEMIRKDGAVVYAVEALRKLLRTKQKDEGVKATNRLALLLRPLADDAASLARGSTLS